MKERGLSGKYDDIIDLPHHVSRQHPQMSEEKRAAQFSPFAALNGYEDAILETGRVTTQETELSEDLLQKLDRSFRFLYSHRQAKPVVGLTVFLPDNRKEGGCYRQLKGRVKKIDLYGRRMTMEDGTEVDLDHVRDLKIIERKERESF